MSRLFSVASVPRPAHPGHRSAARRRHAQAGLVLLVLACTGIGAAAQPANDPRQRFEAPPPSSQKKLTPLPPRPVVAGPSSPGGYNPQAGCGLKAGCGTGPVQINNLPKAPAGTVVMPPAPSTRLQANYGVRDCKLECRKPKAQIPAECRPSCPP